MSEVTRILNAIEHGDPHAANELLPLVYDELRKLAGQKMAKEAPGQTLEATALVDEAMRRILVENARRKRRPKHGGDRQRIELDEVLAVADPRKDLLALDDALSQLAVQEPVKAELVKLRYFAGLSLEQAAAILSISPATAKRYWAVARAWLFAAITESGES